MTVNNLEKDLKTLMKKQKLAVLATCHDNEPYTNLIAFVTSKDLKYIFFVTPKATRKYSYLHSSRKTSLMIDNRSNKESDFRDAIAVNAEGNVREVGKKQEFTSLYLEKHPYLEDFLNSPSSALMRVEVIKYIVASRFQNVMEIDMT